jgi:hypothetical protein
VVSDPREAEDEAAYKLIRGVTAPIYYVLAGLVYSWTGWLGVVGLCIGSVCYGIGSALWFMRRSR